MALPSGARLLFRDYNTEGDSGSGKFRPVKADIVAQYNYFDWLMQFPGTGGTASAYTYTSDATNMNVATVLNSGMIFGLIAHANCDADATLAVDGAAAKNIVIIEANGVRNVNAGEMATAGCYWLRYSAANDKFQLLNPTKLKWTQSNGDFIILTTQGFGVNKLPSAGQEVQGIRLTRDGQVGATQSSAPAAVLTRLATDGALVEFYQDTDNVGTISVSGATVTYGSFTGAHWSQVVGAEPTLRGTVMESLDEMCFWAKDKFKNKTLPKCKVSDTPESSSVYGVFANKEEDGDVVVIGLGTFPVRIEAPAIVRRGDLLVSAGNGCAKKAPQGAEASTVIGKVISTTKVEMYDDSTYCVPCVLYCG